jgi:hypothetical protein
MGEQSGKIVFVNGIGVDDTVMIKAILTVERNGTIENDALQGFHLTQNADITSRRKKNQNPTPPQLCQRFLGGGRDGIGDMRKQGSVDIKKRGFDHDAHSCVSITGIISDGFDKFNNARGGFAFVFVNYFLRCDRMWVFFVL